MELTILNRVETKDSYVGGILLLVAITVMTVIFAAFLISYISDYLDDNKANESSGGIAFDIALICAVVAAGAGCVTGAVFLSARIHSDASFIWESGNYPISPYGMAPIDGSHYLKYHKGSDEVSFEVYDSNKLTHSERSVLIYRYETIETSDANELPKAYYIREAWQEFPYVRFTMGKEYSSIFDAMMVVE